MLRCLRILAALALGAILTPVAARAQTFPAGFYTENAASGAAFDTPVLMAFTPDGRIFVAEKSGLVYIIQNGVKLAEPFVDLSWDVLNHHDRGLLGMAVDPNFAQNGRIYFLYTFDWNLAGDTQRTDVPGRLVRYAASSGNPNVADAATRTVLLGSSFANAIPACYFSHAPGCLRFGTDGTLLVSAGDGASYNEVDAGGLYANCFGAGKLSTQQDIGAFRSQWIQSYAGKILRLDPETGLGLPSNPYWTGNANDIQSKVWAYGLRNPYRFGVRPNGSTDPADGNPGSVYIGDVGWNVYEELNVSGAGGGENFGWPCYEGPSPHGGYQAAAPSHHGCSTIGTPANPSPQIPPLTWWHHGNGGLSFPAGITGATAIGGAFYTGTRFPAQYQGRYFYGDYTGQWIKALTVDANDAFVSQENFASGLGGVVDIEYNPHDQYLYYINIFDGTVLRVRHVDGDNNNPPLASATVSPRWGYPPLLVQFDASASSDPDDDPITVTWDFGDGASSGDAVTSHTYTDSGNYQATLTVRDDFGIETTRVFLISVGNTPPDGTILYPANGQVAALGETVAVFGQATDAESPAQLTYHWEIVQTHNQHDHPNFFSVDGPLGAFTIEEHGLPNEVNFLRVELRVTDASGLTDTSRVYLVLTRGGEHDITSAGTPAALITTPLGGGAPDLSVIHDGVFPPRGSADPLTQYDTYTDGSPRAVDWIGYTFPDTRYFSKVVLQEGIQSAAGGWFTAPDVEVFDNGSWTPVEFVQVIPPYRGDDGVNFDLYTLSFKARAGTGIRVIGPPGGSAHYISVGELRVFEIPRAEFAADVRAGQNPLAVQFTDLSNVTNAESWLWRFGDGATSTDAAPLHVYTVPGPHTVSLTVTGPDGTYFEEKDAYVLVGTPGLAAEYHDNLTLTNPALARIDPVVDVDWGTGSPHASIGADSFSVRWSGWMVPLYSETYTFHTTTDDGVRLWVNDQLVIDHWVDQAPTEWTASLPLVANRFYAVRMEYYEKTGGAAAHLAWSSPGQVLETIPVSRLWARECGAGVGDLDGNGTLTPGDALCVLGTYLNGQVVPASCDAPGNECEAIAADTDCNGMVTPGDALAVYAHYLAGDPLAVCVGQGTLLRSAVPATTVSIARTVSDTDNTVSVTLSVTSRTHVGAFGARLVVPDGFVFEGLSRTAATQSFAMLDARTGADGAVRVGGFDAYGVVAGNAGLVTLTLRREHPGADASAITLTDFTDDLAGSRVEAPGAAPAPVAFRLHQNQPNPFNPSTRIRFDVPVGAGRVPVRLEVYTVRGERVRVLVDDARTPGVYEVNWDGRDASGRTVTSGIYFYKLHAGSFHEARRMVLLK